MAKNKTVLDYLKTTFVFNWATGSAFVLVLIGAVFFYIKSTNLEITVTGLKKTNTELVTKVATLEGQMKGVDHAVDLFNKSNPENLKFRIEQLERYHPIVPVVGPTHTVGDETSTDRIP